MSKIAPWKFEYEMRTGRPGRPQKVSGHVTSHEIADEIITRVIQFYRIQNVKITQEKN